MNKRSRAFLASAVVAFVILAGASALGDYPGGHLLYTYRMETGVGGLAETTTTEITPAGDGRYDVVTTTSAEAERELIPMGMTGFSMRWLGGIDLSGLNALSQQVLDPGRTYVTPDGGLLVTSDRVTVAGLSGVEGVYTQASAPNVKITVVLVDDLVVRHLLPLPLRVELEYSQSSGPSVGLGEGAAATGTYVSGKIELLEYTWSGVEGATE
jgi:hypothetical protein